MSLHTVVVGGGLAGLAASAGLAAHGVRVTLLESRPRPGGRAASFEDRTTGQPVDNCQHVSMGCCDAFRKFCHMTGQSHLLEQQDRLYFVGPDGEVSIFGASRLPAPLHLLPALYSLKFLTASDRRAISRGLRVLARQPSGQHSGSFADWLTEAGQPPTTVRNFWEVVLVSALSESLDRIDVRCARKVFVDGFLSSRTGWQVEIPACPLDELYQHGVATWLKQHGVEIRLKTGVVSLEPGEHGLIDRVQLKNGETRAADDFVCAVPWHRAGDLLPERVLQEPSLLRLNQIESSPITSVHLWFDRAWTDLPHAVLVDRFSQWMFNRSRQLRQTGDSTVNHGTDDAGSSGPPTGSTDDASPSTEGAAAQPPANGWYCQVVISASREAAAMRGSDVVARVLEDLQAIWPECRQRQLLHSRCVTEHRAVFAPLPGIEELRPAQQTAISNLQLAGDWTSTGWPATMEGAVRSGFLAAENILRRHGQSVQLIPAPPARAILSRLLLGLPRSDSAG